MLVIAENNSKVIANAMIKITNKLTIIKIKLCFSSEMKIFLYVSDIFYSYPILAYKVSNKAVYLIRNN